ncbi:large conductance mechanosensitive channel protein [Metamycoplasma cloacale]|uniref:MscL family protein n=1 Tax=Metamycoplasma cloacale TaxID=92401 RepID=A0A2Z4LMR5_9BACT|nr:MscL family protein [Metamycoplasma cloacale]AWX42944.1 MscL family protein [Metamycoplasma cloacale]VEU79232.1 large conductance mechanosensitive channel protein [Metamycoplasma cloacale]
MTKKELEHKKHYFRNAASDARKVVSKGNMFMLAIGIIIGTAFSAVVSSLANDVIMEAIKSIWKGADGDLEKWTLSNGVKIGKFLGALLNFVVVSLFIFATLMIIYSIKNIHDYRKHKNDPITEEPAPEPTHEELMLAELKKMNQLLAENQATKQKEK